MVLHGRAHVLVATLFLLLTTAVNSQIQGCQDNNALCNQWADQGVCRDQQDFMRTRCPVACGLCPTGTTPRPEIVTAEPGCQDNNALCNQWADQGVCTDQQDFMRTRCPVACGLCPTGTSPPPEIVKAESGCQDNNALCNQWADQGVCTNQQDFMRTRCPVACGLCPTGTSPRPEIVTPEPGCTTSSGASGKCVNIRDCPSLLNILKQDQAGTAPAESILRKAICEFHNNEPFVCCPPIEHPVLLKTETHTNTLPTKCGARALVDRIVNGQDASLGAWPWMALLESQNLEGRLSLVCGGVLISERYVLTAAHCVNDFAGTLQSVRLGEYAISKNPDCVSNVCAPSYQSIPIEKTITHENYGSPHGCRFCNDIAMLRLIRPAQLHITYVQPICIPQNLQRDLGFSQNEFTSKNTWVAGWGTTRALSHQKSDVLQEVIVPINNAICGLDYSVFPDKNMVLCAGGERKDTCRGDSGGPMMMSNQRRTKFYLIGLVSKGPVVCGAPNSGGIYTNINYYVPWILQNLQA